MVVESNNKSERRQRKYRKHEQHGPADAYPHAAPNTSKLNHRKPLIVVKGNKCPKYKILLLVIFIFNGDYAI